MAVNRCRSHDIDNMSDVQIPFIGQYFFNGSKVSFTPNIVPITVCNFRSSCYIAVTIGT